MYENDWQAKLAKGARKVGSSADDLAGWVHSRQTGNAFLQVNHDQGRGSIEFCERHKCFLRVGTKLSSLRLPADFAAIVSHPRWRIAAVKPSKAAGQH
jgi:hypothetical protein